MAGDWITLYDVTRDGIGWIPWLIALVWLGGFGVVGSGLWKKHKPAERVIAVIWLLGWGVLGGLGLGNVFGQYVANRHALAGGECQITEGPISEFVAEGQSKSRKREYLVVAGHRFSYGSANLSGGGMRSSAGFDPPLRVGLYIRIWYRGDIIARLDARPLVAGTRPG